MFLKKGSMRVSMRVVLEIVVPFRVPFYKGSVIILGPKRGPLI